MALAAPHCFEHVALRLVLVVLSYLVPGRLQSSNRKGAKFPLSSMRVEEG